MAQSSGSRGNSGSDLAFLGMIAAGEESLAVTFWFGGTVWAVIANLLFLAAALLVPAMPVAAAVPLLLAIAGTAVWLRALWRSSIGYDGERIFPLLARVFAVLAAIGVPAAAGLLLLRP